MTIITDQLEAHAQYLHQLYNEASNRRGRSLTIYEDVRAMKGRLRTGLPVTELQYQHLCRQLRKIGS